MMDGVVGTGELRRLLSALSTGAIMPSADDAERIERVRLFEELQSAAAAAQASEAVAFDRSQRAAQAVAGEPSARQGRGVASQLALARRVSPWAAQRWLGQVTILTSELPATFAQLQAGRPTPWRALLVARETAMLTRADRLTADSKLAPRLEAWGDRQVENEARKLACRLDPAAAVKRARNAEADRRVTIRPAPDTMCRLTALLPVAQGVAAYATLVRDAASLVGRGGEIRGRGQVMTDLLVERVTGQAAADAVPVEIELVMTDRTLLGDGAEPAELIGYGAIPAGVARNLALAGDAPIWLRRLYAAPTGRLVAMESHRRAFTASQQRFIRLHDRACRTPWCDAPVRHTDHVRAHHDGGPTSIGNGQGLCEACNHAKQATGWTTRAGPGGVVHLRTPTGHEYDSRPPDLPGASDRRTCADLRWHRAA